MATVSDRARSVAERSSSPAEAEGLSIARIAQRLGRSPATVKAYFYDPTGEKAKAVKTRLSGPRAASTESVKLADVRRQVVPRDGALGADRGALAP